MKSFIDVSVVAFKGENSWVAQCVEYDIAAFAETPSDLHVALSKALSANFCINAHLGRSGFEGIPAAPEKFKKMFEGSYTRLSPLTDNIGLADSFHLKEMRIA